MYSATGPNRLSTRCRRVSAHQSLRDCLRRHQDPDPSTRTGALEQAQAEKVKSLTPQEPEKFERLTARAEAMLTRGGNHWYPFFENSYSGGGFPFGAGYSWFVGPYRTLDVRGSITPSGYTRAEAEFLNPRIFNRRGTLSVIGGWGEATEVPFYGLGDSQPESRVSYGFKRPHVSGLLTLKPTRRLLVVSGGIEYTQWKLQPGQGGFPSVDDIFTPDALAGLGKVNYHRRAGSDSTAPGGCMRAAAVSGGITARCDTTRHRFRGFTRRFSTFYPARGLGVVVSVERITSRQGRPAARFRDTSLGSGSTLRAYPTRRVPRRDTRFAGNGGSRSIASWTPPFLRRRKAVQAKRNWTSIN